MAVEIGQEVAVFIRRTVEETWTYTGSCTDCCKHGETETFARTEVALEPSPGIFIKGNHIGLQGVHVVRALHLYSDAHDEESYYWELVS